MSEAARITARSLAIDTCISRLAGTPHTYEIMSLCLHVWIIVYVIVVS